jgi:hypothetical protein
MFYASHFLGHVPVYTVLALIFVGTYICFTDFAAEKYTKTRLPMLFVLLTILLFLSIVISFTVFGHEDTLAFVLQQKQNISVSVRGGPWNLHLPSTVVLFFLIPIYLYGIKMLLKKNIHGNTKGLLYITIGVLLFFFFTAFLNGNIVDVFLFTWMSPRYLAHSVRELLTFPITYFPLPVYFILRGTKDVGISEKRSIKKWLRHGIGFFTAICLAGFFYQSYVSLSEGISDLAQKPFFARNGKLGVLYLLASHFFEHFLDTIYFTLLCLLLYGIALQKQQGTRE